MVLLLITDWHPPSRRAGFANSNGSRRRIWVFAGTKQSEDRTCPIIVLHIAVGHCLLLWTFFIHSATSSTTVTGQSNQLAHY
jgi:hypothetical protein